MIQRFNFYDIYGYLLPGLALLSLIWLPFVLVSVSWPSVGWSGAAVMVAFSYIVGHPLQNLARQILPSRVKMSGNSGGTCRYPSDFVLDSSDRTLDDALKLWLGEYAKQEFKLDLSTEKGEGDWSEDIGRRRERAFFMARTDLISRGLAGYAEQFEGMYSLMRGLSAAFFLGGVYALGWTLSVFTFPHARATALLVALAGLATALLVSVVTRSVDKPEERMKKDRATSCLVVLVVLVAGYGLATGTVHALGQCIELGSLFLAAWFFSRRCYLSYQFFATEFAKTVWRDFASCHLSPSPSHS